MFAAQSKLFAVSMCSKISDMIKGQATPASMKLQLIPILQYMHHDTYTASMVCNIGFTNRYVRLFYIIQYFILFRHFAYKTFEINVHRF